MNKFFAKLLLLFFVLIAACQNSFSQRNANWEVVPYSDNIVKVTYHPFEYNKDFNVTNAVIAKPQAMYKADYKINQCKLDESSAPSS